jgi:Flp pilus assembly pilin Flp
MEVRNLTRTKSSIKKSCDEFGGSLVEYGLLVALVALIAIPSLGGLNQSLVTKFELTSVALANGGFVPITSLPQD